MSDTPFPVRVYYEDTDFSGNVYHGAYIRFFERGRTEWLRARGVHHSALATEGLAFAVTRMEVDFKQAAHIDDALAVTTEMAEIKGARILLDQSIARDGALLAVAKVTIVVITSDGKATRLPKHLRAACLNSD